MFHVKWFGKIAGRAGKSFLVRSRGSCCEVDRLIYDVFVSLGTSIELLTERTIQSMFDVVKYSTRFKATLLEGDFEKRRLLVTSCRRQKILWRHLMCYRPLSMLYTLCHYHSMLMLSMLCPTVWLQRIIMSMSTVSWWIEPVKWKTIKFNPIYSHYYLNPGLISNYPSTILALLSSLC